MTCKRRVYQDYKARYRLFKDYALISVYQDGVWRSVELRTVGNNLFLASPVRQAECCDSCDSPRVQ